ncbi:MAG: extracellular solute-binding protein [Clostridia bacterium]
MKKTIIIIVLVMILTVGLTMFSGCDDSYDLVYTSWNLSTKEVNNIERKMVSAFEEKYKVKIKIEENISLAAYDDSITGLAAKGELPDVFMLSNMNYGLSNQYLMDISTLIKDDNEWSSIPKPIEEAVHWGEGVYAVPFAMHMMGYFINTNMFADNNVAELTANSTYEQFLSVAKQFSSKVTDGKIGLSNENTILEWYPSYKDTKLGWFSWDGEKYNLDSEAFKEGVAKTKEMRQNTYTYDSLSEETRGKYFEGIDGYTMLWDQGRLAMRWGYTFEIPDMLSKNGGEFNIKFIGVPGERTPLVGDYVGISSTCKNPTLAYQFSKWMSFGSEGMAKRLELDTESKENNTLPLTTNKVAVKAYFDKYLMVDGLEELYTTLDKGIVEGVKVIPGYNRSRWLALTGLPLGDAKNCNIGALLDACWFGTETYADYAIQLNTLANKQYQKAIKDYADLYGRK